MHHNESLTGSLNSARGELADSLARHEANSAASAYAEDARLLPPLVDVVEGREQIRAFWQAGIESGITTLDLEPLDCVEVGEVAYELGRYAISAIPADADTAGHITSPSVVVEHGRYLTVHRLIDGRWLRAVEMFTSDNQPGGDQQ